MKAWHFTNTNEPLVKVEKDAPTPTGTEVVVDTKVAGLCHSDVGLLDDEGWLSLLGHKPIAPGHEVAGVISAVGEDVKDWKVGDRVVLCPTAGAGAPGYAMDGGFAEKVKIDQKAVVALPDNVTFAQGAAATDAGMTSYHAMFTKGGVKEGMKVGVIGLGGLGQYGARAAVLKGAEVYVAEVNEAVWDMAREIGAKDVAKSIKEFKDQELDVIVDYAGFDVTTAEAVETVKLGGRVVLVGMGKLEFTLSTMAVITGQVEIVGSNGGTKEDVQGILDLYATGKLNPKMTEITWDEIPQGIDDLRDGKVIGRLVANYEA